MKIIDEFIKDNEFPIVPISAKKNINMDNLHSEIANKINSLTGKELREISVKIEKFDILMNWIKE